MKRPFTVFVVALLLAFAGYWYVYGRERDLFEATNLSTYDRDFARYIFSKKEDESESKRLSEVADRRSAALSRALDGRLTLTPDGSGGSTLAGSVVGGNQNWIINRAYIHIRLFEKRHCGEKLQNVFSDLDWDKKCASDPTHSVMDVVAGQSYQCFIGRLAYGETAHCDAETLLPFDPSKQSWDFFFSKVTGHPTDPLGIFN